MSAYLGAIVQVCSENVGDLLVGDFNTGIGSQDGPSTSFGGMDRLMALQNCGFTDEWRWFHGNRMGHTWSRHGKAWRIDHALASPGLLPRIRSCRYSHQERIDAVSDHSIVIIEIGDSGGARTRDPLIKNNKTEMGQ